MGPRIYYEFACGVGDYPLQGSKDKDDGSGERLSFGVAYGTFDGRRPLSIDSDGH